MGAFICDIDGTIADIGHRLHYIKTKPKNWDAFYDACDQDGVVEQVKVLVHALSAQNFQVLYVSGRRNSIRQKTLDWLNTHGFPSGNLYMRKDEDFRPDVEVKLEIYEQLIKPERYEILLALEDRDQVVKLWRDLGLTCLQVKDGDY